MARKPSVSLSLCSPLLQLEALQLHRTSLLRVLQSLRLQLSREAVCPGGGLLEGRLEHVSVLVALALGAAQKRVLTESARERSRERERDRERREIKKQGGSSLSYMCTSSCRCLHSPKSCSRSFAKACSSACASLRREERELT